MAKCGFIYPNTDEALKDIDNAVMTNCTQRPILINDKNENALLFRMKKNITGRKREEIDIKD